MTVRVIDTELCERCIDGFVYTAFGMALPAIIRVSVLDGGPISDLRTGWSRD